MRALLDIIHDPFGRHSAYKIKQHPQGRRLSWLSLEKVSRRGWNGWTPVQKGDGIYERVEDHVSESPLKYMRSVDSTVIRGHNILAWIPLGMFLARKLKGAEKANSTLKRQKEQQDRIPQQLRPFADVNIRSRKKDPMKLENIMSAYQITEEEMQVPEADPRNYARTEGGKIPVSVPINHGSDGEPVVVVSPPMPKKRGRPKGSTKKPPLKSD